MCIAEGGVVVNCDLGARHFMDMFMCVAEAQNPQSPLSVVAQTQTQVIVFPLRRYTATHVLQK